MAAAVAVVIVVLVVVVVVDVKVIFMLDDTKTLDAASVCQVTPGSPRCLC